MKKVLFLFILINLTLYQNLLSQEDTAKKAEVPKDIFFYEKSEPPPEKMKEGFDSITARDAGAYLHFLSSDPLEGRDTSTSFFDIAAEYAASLFTIWGILPAGDFPLPQTYSYFDTVKRPNQTNLKQRTYFQKMSLKKHLDRNCQITVKMKKAGTVQEKIFHLNIDFIDSTTRASNFQKISAPAVFVGFGISEKIINFDEFKGIDVKGKIVLLFSGVPQSDKEDTPFKKGKLKEKYYPSFKKIRSTGWAHIKKKLIVEKGALAVLEISISPKQYKIADMVKLVYTQNDEEPPYSIRRDFLTLDKNTPFWSWNQIPYFKISEAMGEQILDFENTTDEQINLKALAKKIENTLKPQSRLLEGIYVTISNSFRTEPHMSCNVLGFIEGSDPELKKEAVVIGAHLDHIGKRGDYIYNGANDNASGSAAVLELAQAFALNPIKPRRSILFALWTGEEYNFLGSRYYIENPYFSLEKTVGYINMDMIGWPWEDKKKLNNSLKVWDLEIPDDILKDIDLNKFLMPNIADNSPEMYEIVKDCARYIGGVLYLRKMGGIVGGSDYVPFGRKNIPWAHFTTGNCKFLHHPGDSEEKISLELVEKVIRFIYTISFSLADKQ